MASGFIMPPPKYPVIALSEHSEKEKTWLYFKTLMGSYEQLSVAKDLRIEMRCRRKIHEGKDESLHNLQYFPLTDEGYWDAVDYVWEYREDWEIFNAILPRYDKQHTGFGLMTNASTPYFAVWGVDIDGKGEYGPTPGFTARKSAIQHFKEARERRPDIPMPHMSVLGANGIHNYWLLDKPYSLDYERGDWIYQQNLQRFGRWISGEPDTFNRFDKPAYSGPHADTNQTYRAATLRPAGSKNHKIKDSPVTLELVRLDLNASPFMQRTEWSLMMPPPIDPPIPDLSDASVDPTQAGPLGPGQRRPLKKRVVQFMREGVISGGFHAIMTAVVSDVCWCNYTPEEGFGLLVKGCGHAKEIEELRDYLFPQSGMRLRFGPEKWNTYVIYPDLVLDRQMPADDIIKWIRDKS